mmetsp:Transcript_7248/g.9451  ORF Transcript_7248/g.9451 Transcript_7248/m.9451 type:complete len:190 (+) Transcript_7248:163-732(+)|eukprot:CAMPEP_0198146190 /NCGR_PEP_ID=MMETSP1443-20131203/28055_1 /TAXON_ID=186043 /ORGANISM="Entomoneis sp., Strain CCMP2396" /LENGTH=189 /DNA_ID=CAMNT_0043810065 /DNA_START=67 /DNA_END=636 /DNA_ORIENTATION=+
MSTAATATAADTRNLEWKDNNIGSKLLGKMGWKEGQSIGKRRKRDENVETSTEGLRIKRRADGLGLGASSVAASNAKSTHHVADFSSLLVSLNEQHATTNTQDKRSKKRKKRSVDGPVVAFATNRATHAKVRQAKFQEKTADDYKSIFAGADIFASMAAAVTSTANSKREKKERKKSKKSSSSKKEKEK